MNIDKWLSQEFTRITKIADKEEKQRQLTLLAGIIEKNNEYQDYLWDYKKFLLAQDMKNRGIIFEKSEYGSEEFMSIWENNFAAGLSEEDKENIFFHHHMWHVFSYEAKDALAKSKARQAFNKKRKNKAYLFFHNKEEVFYIAKAQLLKASDFDMEQDVYIIDSEMKWTYIHTHELQCGPYFVHK